MAKSKGTRRVHLTCVLTVRNETESGDPDVLDLVRYTQKMIRGHVEMGLFGYVDVEKVSSISLAELDEAPFGGKKKK